MIVPRSRLLFWFGVVVLPFSCLGAVEPATAIVSLAVIGVFGVVALADALGARTGLTGIGVDLPPISRMSKDREGKLDLRIHNERQRPKTVRLALVLPREFQSPIEDTLVALPGNSEWSRLSWSCVPRRRGRFRLETACLEAGSPLGLW